MQSSRSVATAETVLDSMGLLLTSHRRGRCLVVDVCGNVGAGTEGQLHTRLRAALESDLLLIAVNLAEAVLADAYALEVLTSIHRRAAAASKIFLVVAPDPQAHETMRVTGLDQSLLVFPTVADFNAWNGDPAARPAGGGFLAADKPPLSWCTWLGFWSVRSPRQLGWRRTWSVVHSVKATSPTSRGCTHWAPRACGAGTAVPKGLSARRSGSSRCVRSARAAWVKPVPTCPA
jgi:anti-anti-sigma regulatory factor